MNIEIKMSNNKNIDKKMSKKMTTEPKYRQYFFETFLFVHKSEEIS